MSGSRLRPAAAVSTCLRSAHCLRITLISTVFPPGCNFYPGDFLQDALPKADVVVLGRILHNWDLPTKKLLLSKVYDALPAGGALVVYERPLPFSMCTSKRAPWSIV
jgi:hypothetical protein